MKGLRPFDPVVKEGKDSLRVAAAQLILKRPENEGEHSALSLPFSPAAGHGSGFPSPCGERAREALRACRDKYKLNRTDDEIEAVYGHREIGQIHVMPGLQLLQRREIQLGTIRIQLFQSIFQCLDMK